MMKEIDYTKKIGKDIRKCPKCGRNGKVTYYSGRDFFMFEHRIEIKELMGLPIPEITDCCIAKGDKK